MNYLPDDVFAYAGNSGFTKYDVGADLTDRGSWVGTLTYNPRDVVKVNTQLNVSIQVSINQRPLGALTYYWSPLAIIKRGNANFAQAQLRGDGPPEGVVFANAGATYVDRLDGSFYWKTTDGTNTGWKPT